MALIELKQVSYRAGDQEILQDVSFAVEEGDYLTLTGPSGSGKSTTLKLIAGLISPNKGEIFFTRGKILIAWIWSSTAGRCPTASSSQPCSTKRLRTTWPCLLPSASRTLLKSGPRKL